MPTSRSRYREERTLVRALLPLPGQTRDAFRQNARLLRRHFEQFNADVAGLCQWLIRFRPGSNRPVEGAQAFWDFILEPEKFLPERNETQQDYSRLQVIEAAVGWEGQLAFADDSLTSRLHDSILAVASFPQTVAARAFFARLRAYSPTHRMILCKAAAEWTVARYVRVYQNSRRQREEWQKEKTEWESRHPELTEEVREKFNDIFRQLQVTEKRPRICAFDRLQQSKANCEYAGERVLAGDKWKSHSTLCTKYVREFLRSLPPPLRKHFVINAKEYLAGGDIGRLHPSARRWFPKAWQEYLRILGVQEVTIRSHQGRLPHCENLNRDCEFNPHTEKCKKYHSLVSQLPDSQLRLEPLYREWRRHYLSGPRKPEFQYPSARSLSTPKLFGKDYFEADFDRAVLGLRLDNMAEGEFLKFAFKPWPRDYSPQPGDADITSVQVHFAGTRPRAGFRFRVVHKESCFKCTQDELDELRSRTFPRQAQDQQFLDAARELLLKSFDGEPEMGLKLLAVDLGDRGAYAAFFEGKHFKQAHPLKVVKIERLYDAPPETEISRKPGDRATVRQRSTRKGLGKDHVGRHLKMVGQEAGKISSKRGPTDTSGLRPHDLRRLTDHVGWMVRDWARLNASQIIQLAQTNAIDLIVFESLRGTKPPGYDKLDLEKKRRLAFFAYGRIRRKVAEKAVERGMRVVTVPYLYSSQVCSQCGQRILDRKAWQKNKRRRLFRCERKECGYKSHSDDNAARVLGRVFWGEIVLPTRAD